MSLPLHAALAALSLLFTAPEAALAQETSAEEQNISAQETPWQVNCSPVAEGSGLACSMVKSLMINDGKQVLAQAAVVAPEAEGAFLLRILAPHGMALADGLVLSVDGTEVATAAYRTSLAGGALAVTELGPDLEAALRSGSRLEIAGVQNNGSALRLELGLAGFAAAMDKLR